MNNTHTHTFMCLNLWHLYTSMDQKASLKLVETSWNPLFGCKNLAFEPTFASFPSFQIDSSEIPEFSYKKLPWFFGGKNNNHRFPGRFQSWMTRTTASAIPLRFSNWSRWRDSSRSERMDEPGRVTVRGSFMKFRGMRGVKKDQKGYKVVPHS